MLVTNIPTMVTRAERTRRSLQEVAVRLFESRGYDNVTVEEVAGAAGVSHMTFFRHFPTKVSVLLDDPYDPIIGEMVAKTDPELPAMERVRRGLLDSWAQIEEPEDETTRIRFRILTRHEDLIAHAWANNRRTEQVIVDALTSTGVARLEARVVAGAVMGALMAALIDWGEDDGSGSLGNRVRRALEQLGSTTGSANG
jgi:AcrR family transcriptional regulator